MFKMMKMDWSAAKYYYKRTLLVPLCMLVVGALSAIYLVPMGAFLMFSISVNPFAVEEKGDLNRFYLTLPVKRRAIVQGRYALSIVLCAGGILLGAVLMPLANLFSLSRWYPDFKWMLAIVSFSFLFYGMMSLAMYPQLFRLGYQKGKIWGYYLPAGIICLLYVGIMEYDALVKGGLFVTELLIFASEHVLAVSGGMLALGALLLGISYALSVQIYGKREF